MKRFLKYLSRFFLLLIVAFVIFFFWASSPTLELSEYQSVIANKTKSTQKSDSIFSIVTYNIGYLSGMTNNLAVESPKEFFDVNMAKVVSEIKKVKPDIMAFQEIDFDASRSYNVNQEEEISKLGFNYRAQTINWDKRYLPFPYWPISMHYGKVVSGQSIISKYPLCQNQLSYRRLLNWIS